MSEKPIGHCLADYGEWIEEAYGCLSDEYLDRAVRARCMRPAGHYDPHEWTPIVQIAVTFGED